MTKESILKLVKEYSKGDISAYKKIIDGLTDDIRKETLKSKGTRPKDITIIDRVLKDACDNIKGYSPFKGYKVFTNRNFALGSQNDFGYKEISNPFNFERIFYDNCFIEGDKVKIDLVDLKTFIKTHKTVEDKRQPYILKSKNFIVGCNPRYLQDVLTFCNTNEVMLTGELKGIYIQNKQVDRFACLMPIRINK